MADKALITSKFATPSDVAKRLRIPAERVRELEKLISELRIERKTYVEAKQSTGRTKSRRSGTSTHRAVTPSKKR